MKNKSKKIILLVSLLIVLLITGCRDDKEEVKLDLEEDYLAVEVESVKVRDLDSSRRFSANILPGDEALVIPMMIGQAESVQVALGDRVEAGNHLFTINQDEMKSNMKKAQLGVDMAREAVEHSKELLDTARSNQTKLKEEIEKGKEEVSELKGLVENELLDPEALVEAEKGMEAGNSQLKAMESQVSQAEMGLSQAEGQLKQAELNYSQLKDGMDKTIVRAPISGIVSSLDVKKGQLVTNSQPAAVIVNIDRLKIEFFLTENMVNQVSLGQELDLEIPALDRRGIRAEIEYISPVADLSNGLYLVRSTIDNPDHSIKPGMSLDLSIKTEEIQDSLAIPLDAVLRDREEQFVYLAKDNRALKRKLELGQEFGDLVEVKSGLKAGDKLIIKGQEYAEDGRRIKIVGGEGQ